MRASGLRETVAGVVVGAALCGCSTAPPAARADEAPAQTAAVSHPFPVFEFPLTADADLLRARIAERVLFDDVLIDVRESEHTISVGRADRPVGEKDFAVRHLRALDADLAENARFVAMSDDELAQRVDAAFAASTSNDEYWARDRILLEVVRRGGDVWRDRVGPKVAPAVAGRIDHRTWNVRDFQLLTALRRLEGRPDPVRIEAPASMSSVYPDIPRVSLRLVNRDETTVRMKRGGNYRFSRKTRWHVEVRDAGGRIMPETDWPSDLGGLTSLVSVAPGGSMESTLELADYVAPLPPGDYRVRIRYHDRHRIADPEDSHGNMTVESDELLLHVTGRVVVTPPAERERLDALADALPIVGDVAVPSRDSADRSGLPSSAAELLAAGWQAVPSLVRVSCAEDAPDRRRAWARTLMHAISSAFEPLYLDSEFQTETARRWAAIAAAVDFRENP